MPTDATVYIVEDDPTTRQALQWLLESVGLEVRACADGREFLDAYRPDRPGCLLLDLRLPDRGGLIVQEELIRRGTRLPVIVISGHATVAAAVRAMKHGAVDVLEKPVSDERLLECVQEAVAVDRRRRAKAAAREQAARDLAVLTARETQVLDRLLEGLAAKQIAQELGISRRTVEVHRARLLQKLGVQSIAKLVRLAVAAGRCPAAA